MKHYQDTPRHAAKPAHAPARRYAQEPRVQEERAHSSHVRSDRPRNVKKPSKKGKPIILALLVIFIIGFLVGGFMLGRTLWRAHKEQQTFDELASMVKDTDEVNDDGTLRKYDELYKKNPDFFGWLKIEGTKINYPVMYKPSDPEYYLHRDFYGEYSDSGMLFIDGQCPEKSNYYLIYGHHMNNGTMFGELPKYADIDFYNKHKTVFFDTRYEIRDYEVVAAFEAEVYDVKDEAGKFCYYNYKNLSSPEVFDEYIANVKQRAIYETGITPTFGDELITLSTCNYHTEDGRFVVVCRRIKDSEKNSNKKK